MKTPKTKVGLPVRAKMCALCPFRPGSKYAALADTISNSAIKEHNRICHSTGSNAINRMTGKPPALCRGARDLQLKVFAHLEIIRDATDEAWNEKLAEVGLPPQPVQR